MSIWSRLFRVSAGDQYHKGIRYFNEGDYDRAIECLEEVVAGDKSRESPIAKLGAFYAAEAHSKLGIAEFHRENYDKALIHFKAALQVNPHYPDLYYYLGVVNHKQGELDVAVEYLKKATELNPDYAEATCYLGIALHDGGYFDRAGKCFSHALELTRAVPNPLSRLLMDKLESKSFEHPILQELKNAALENTNFEETVKEGNRAFNNHDYERAAACFAEASHKKPSYADLHCKLGLAFLELGRDEEAIESLKRSLQQNPTYVEALYCLGVTCYQGKDYVASREHLERAVALRPEYADIHCQLGIAMLALGEFAAAKDRI